MNYAKVSIDYSNIDAIIKIDVNGDGHTDVSITLEGHTELDYHTMIDDGNIVLSDDLLVVGDGTIW